MTITTHVFRHFLFDIRILENSKISKEYNMVPATTKIHYYRHSSYFSPPTNMSCSELELLEQTLQGLGVIEAQSALQASCVLQKNEKKVNIHQQPQPTKRNKIQVTFSVVKAQIRLLEEPRIRHRSEHNRNPYEHNLRGPFTFYIYEEQKQSEGYHPTGHQAVGAFQLTLKIGRQSTRMPIPRPIPNAKYDRKNKSWTITCECEVSDTLKELFVVIWHPRAHPMYIRLC
jgi:hypothetical protein